RTVQDHVGGFKVGLELLMAEGPMAVETVAGLGHPVFADAKLHDIPNTVAGAAAQLGVAGARWVTAHASGGSEMLEAAVDGLRAGSEGGSGVLAVTVLTSQDDVGLLEAGVEDTVLQQVRRLAVTASRAGVEGVICASHEIEMIKTVDRSLLVVTPGIRMPEGDTHDQKRVATPANAIRQGADYIVVGRSITMATDPAAAAMAVSAAINEPNGRPTGS
ncbi:MAG: orotidine-5'-phosphate decarboxylase, partial [Acidimicrobiia bacterium]